MNRGSSGIDTIMLEKKYGHFGCWDIPDPDFGGRLGLLCINK